MVGLELAGRTAWETTCELLERWSSSGAPHPYRAPTEEYELWGELVEQLREPLEEQPGPELSRQDAEAIGAVVGEAPITLHAAATAIDATRSHTFSRSWARGRVITPTAGALYPVTEWDAGSRPLSSLLPAPSRTELREDELAHVRRYRPAPDEPPVVFDGRFFDDLLFLADLRTVSVPVLNSGVEDFVWPGDGFPVEPRDAADQVHRAVAALEAEIAGPAGLVVLPELSVPAGGVDELAQRVADAPRELIVVAGSRHCLDGGRRRNVATLLLPSGEPLEWDKREPYVARHVRERIDPVDEPLRILVAGQTRLAVAICKDWITPVVRQTLARCGANLVAVPSLSSTLHPHDTAARDLAGRSHAVTVVANLPVKRSDGHRAAQALVGRPTSDRPIIEPAATPPGSVVRVDVMHGSVDILNMTQPGG